MKVVLFKVNNKVVDVLELKEVSAYEYATLFKEAEENRQEIKNEIELYQTQIQHLEEKVVELENEIKTLKGED